MTRKIFTGIFMILILCLVLIPRCEASSTDLELPDDSRVLLMLSPEPLGVKILPPDSFLNRVEGQYQYLSNSNPFKVTYRNAGYDAQKALTFVTVPSEVKAAIEYTLEIWASLINSKGPISVTFGMAKLDTGVLGASYVGTIHRDFSGAPLQNVWYRAAMANAFSGEDVNGEDSPEIDIVMSSEFSWYYGIDGNCPATKMDFVSVILHEVCHGLGFSGSAQYRISGGTAYVGIGYNGYPMIYDKFIVHGSSKTPIMTYKDLPSSLGPALTSNSLYFNGIEANKANGGSMVPIYAPYSWSSGSSYSHVGEKFRSDGSGNTSMLYSAGYGDVAHSPGPVVLGIFKDMGWQIGNDVKKVTSIALSVPNNDKTVLAGQTKQVTATVLPADADDPSVTWTSSNTGVATVDANGLVTAKMISTQTDNVTITAAANDGSNIKGNIALQVNRPSVTGVYFSPYSLELARGASYNLYNILHVDPEDALKPAASALTWKSSDTSAVSVTNEGVITVLKDTIAPGTVYVEVAVSVSSTVTRTDQCYIYTPGSSSGVTFNLTTKLEGRRSGGGSGSNVERITVAVYSLSNAKLFEGAADTNENGVVTFNIPAGVVSNGDSVKLWIKGARYLAKLSQTTANISSNTWNYAMSDALKAGDADNDNAARANDFAEFYQAYPSVEGGTAYNANADFDGDGAIRTNDFTLFYMNYPGTGDERPVTTTTAVYREANKNGTLGTLLQNTTSSADGRSSSGGCSAGIYGAAFLALCLLPLSRRGKK